MRLGEADIDRVQNILGFWWDSGPEKWFARSDAFDEDLRRRFLEDVEAAACGALDHWIEAPDAALALILLLDQFPRNLYRQSAQAFASDAKALAMAEEALERGYPQRFPKQGRSFFYMPFMHAEDLQAQLRCVELFRAEDLKENHYYALIHMEAILRFSRFPHRNAVLGRETTPQEAAYLASGGFSA